MSEPIFLGSTTPEQDARLLETIRKVKLTEARMAAERIVLDYERMNKLLPLAGGVPRPVEQSDDHAVIVARVLLAEHPADDDDNADVTWLMDDHGFDYSGDGTALVKKFGGFWEVVCGVRRHRGEVEVSSLALHFNYPGPPRIDASYAIEDDPTRGTIRRLLLSLDT